LLCLLGAQYVFQSNAPGGNTLIRYVNLSGEERLSIEPRTLRKENMHVESFFR
jgi:hypothetical protein